ncbi:MAG: hypothetical protein Q9200_005911 [Gallowayella weberi]
MALRRDLAALVGIFATDSVERYAVDYTKGYLTVASTTLSLLGLLGYVRALVKFGLGSLSCQNAGFDTRSLRPLFGIPKEDRLPSDAVHNVYYVERSRSAQNVRWKVVATRKHTVDSMPILELAVQHPVDEVKRVKIHSYCLNARVEKWYKSHACYRIPMIFGLTIRPVVEEGVFKQKPSLQRKDYFAFTSSNYSYAMFDLRAVTGLPRTIARTVSLAGALSAIIGYVEQDLHKFVRRLPPKLLYGLAIQGLLAIIRVAFWIWNPEFDDFTMKNESLFSHIRLSEAQLVMLWYSHIHPKRVKLPNDTESSPEKDDRYIQEIMHNSQACPPDFNVEWILDDLTIPIWVLHGLDIAETKIQDMFAYASILSLSEGPRWQEVFQTVAAIELYWDMPEWMFMLWIDAHTDQQSLAEKMEWKSSFGCRVIPDADGRIQLIPFWMIVSKRLERGEIDRKPSIYQYPVHKRPPKLCVFGNPESEDHCIVTTSKDSAEDRSMRCFQTGN